MYPVVYVPTFRLRPPAPRCPVLHFCVEVQVLLAHVQFMHMTSLLAKKAPPSIAMATSNSNNSSNISSGSAPQRLVQRRLASSGEQSLDRNAESDGAGAAEEQQQAASVYDAVMSSFGCPPFPLCALHPLCCSSSCLVSPQPSTLSLTPFLSFFVIGGQTLSLELSLPSLLVPPVTAALLLTLPS